MSQSQINARRYAWFRKAFVSFEDDEVCNTALNPLGLCQMEDAVDAAIDAELAKAALNT